MNQPPAVGTQRAVGGQASLRINASGCLRKTQQPEVIVNRPQTAPFPVRSSVQSVTCLRGLLKSPRRNHRNQRTLMQHQLSLTYPGYRGGRRFPSDQVSPPAAAAEKDMCSKVGVFFFVVVCEPVWPGGKGARLVSGRTAGSTPRFGSPFLFINCD